MAKGKLYEYAVIYHPRQTKEQRDVGEEPKSILLVEPSTVLATSDAEVSILAARKVPETHVDKLNDVEIVVRPF